MKITKQLDRVAEAAVKQNTPENVALAMLLWQARDELIRLTADPFRKIIDIINEYETMTSKDVTKIYIPKTLENSMLMTDVISPFKTVREQLPTTIFGKEVIWDAKELKVE